MPPTTRRARPGRPLLALALIIVALAAVIGVGAWRSDATLAPKLALDLEGGTQVILEPVADSGAEVTADALDQAIDVIRQRIDASGVAEASITREGDRNIVVGIPGEIDDETLKLISTSAQMRFRAVLAVADPGPTVTATADPSATASSDGAQATPTPDATSAVETPAADVPVSPDATPMSNTLVGDGVDERSVDGDLSAQAAASPSPTPEATPTAQATADSSGTAAPTSPSDTAWITSDVEQEFNDLDCTNPENLQGGGGDDPDKPLVTCESDGTAKYILGPAEVEGSEIQTATSGLGVNSRGVTTNQWVVNLTMKGDGADQFREVTTRVVSLEAPRNRFAMVLDGLVISAPSVNNAITDGRAEISGSFTRDSAATLARQLNFGALPLTFEVQSQEQISATLGSSQLQHGLLAGLIGLVLVVIYSAIQYRALGAITVGSLAIAAVLTYEIITLLSWLQGYRLSLAGVAGLIVAIGITADSFIVYFERVRDELRDGRALTGAVEHGWSRAQRTILASDAVNFLAAIVLYFLAVGGVRGFAFTLGLTTIIDLVVVFLFTHPTLQLVARTRFFGEGHRFSGLDPQRLQVTGARYAGRGRVAMPQAATAAAPSVPSEPSQDGLATAGVGAGATGPAPAGADPGGRRLTIAERRRAQARAGGGAGAAGSSDATTSDEKES